jgi:hypothetical protein
VLTAPTNPRTAKARVPRLPPMAGQRPAATGAVRRPKVRRARHRATKGIVAALVLLAAMVIPVYAISTGRAPWAERLVPREEALRLTQYLGNASPETMILLFLGIFAFLVAIWATVCAASYTVGSVVARARRR